MDYLGEIQRRVEEKWKLWVLELQGGNLIGFCGGKDSKGDRRIEKERA